jgi:molybdate transport system ATP-binding protein
MALTVQITKKAGDFTLDVAFEASDEWIGLLGASGCGKSMTLKCIAGIETPDKGVIRYHDRLLFDSEKGINLPPQKRHVGYLFQSYALFPHMTVLENIASGIPKETSQKMDAAREMITAFCLETLEDKRPCQLSGGQQQRVALARLFASRPDMILLDEPFSALDSHLKWKMEQDLMQSMDKFQGTVLMVSHNRDEIYRMCKRVGVLSHGQVDAFGNMHDIFHSPGTVNAAVLTGCKNISRAQKVDDYTVHAVDFGMVLKTDRPVPVDVGYVGIRAHHIKIDANQDFSENTFLYEVVRVIDNPFSSLLFLKRPDAPYDRNAIIQCEVEKSLLQNPGKYLYASILMRDILLLK